MYMLVCNMSNLYNYYNVFTLFNDYICDVNNI